MSDPLSDLPGTGNSPHANPRDPQPSGRSVLNGTLPLKEALARDAVRVAPPPGSANWLRPGQTLDPVLAHHLRRDRY